MISSGRLVGQLNRLEHWLNATRSRYHLFPARMLGYGLLLTVLTFSNLVALVRWPVAALLRRYRHSTPAHPPVGAPVDADGEKLRQLMEERRPVLVDFWAEWCGPCVMMNQSLRALAREYADDLLVAKVNTVSEPGLAKEYGVKGLPTLVLLRDGREIRRNVGALSRAELVQFIAPR